MSQFDLIQFALFLLLLVAVTRPLGQYMASVFEGDETVVTRWLGPIERFLYKAFGVDPKSEMSWGQYAIALMCFNIVGIAVVFLIQMIQGALPLNPQNLGSITWDSALNTAVSFVTNTNWQGYAGETTVSYFTQMTALTVQNFVSAGVGISVAVALSRAISRRSATSIGNFWFDLTRSTLYILLPLSIVFGAFLVGEGVVQTFSPYVTAQTLEGGKQTIALGPAASQVAIKMIGTNGGGFFNANSAHPFENPTPLSNFLQMLAIFAIPAALTYTFGTIARARKHGWVIFSTMLVLFVGLTTVSLWTEISQNPRFAQGSLMEGKETRFGIFGSVMFSTVTTAASCGAVNSMHSSLSPLSGGVAMLNMMLGEIIFGGVGAGLYGMFLFVLLTVFIAGLMVGRTPEYLGKKIEAKEIKLVILAVLAPCIVILLGTALSVATPPGVSSVASKGPHGFSEVLYALTSAAANNGSAFAGLNANTPFYNLLLALAMFVGRFAVILPILGIAGSLAAKKHAPVSSGTFEVHTPLFAVMLLGVILIVGALTFLPALSLGPVLEHLLMLNGRAF